MSAPRISLVIPAYNDAKFLPRLLDTVDAARAQFAGRGEVEVIVADNMSTDDTARIAAERGCRVVTVTTRAIAAVRNGGAKAASGEILGCVDADMRIHPDSFIAIYEAMRRSGVVGGATGVTMERWSVGIAATFAMLMSIIWVTGFDTGIVFCRRADFERLGGYDETKKAAEDVLWLAKLWKDGRTRGEKLVRLRGVKCISSARKFDEFGDWHYFRFLWDAPMFFLRKGRLNDMWDKYWYKPDR